MTHSRDSFDPRTHDTPVQGGYAHDLSFADRDAVYTALYALEDRQAWWPMTLAILVVLGLMGFAVWPLFAPVVEWVAW